MEYITSVDENDNVIGKAPITKIGTKEIIHRGAHLLLFNYKEDKMLTQKRKTTMHLYPGRWSCAVSGTVRYNENYEETIGREVKEEIGIEIPLKKLFKFSFEDKFIKSWETVFKGNYEGEFKIQEDEVEAIRWVDVEQLKDDVNKTPEKYAPPFVKMVQIYFSKQF